MLVMAVDPVSSCSAADGQELSVEQISCGQLCSAAARVLKAEPGARSWDFSLLGFCSFDKEACPRLRFCG